MTADKTEIAKQKVARFIARFGESYRRLAQYAALPMVLTPELLNYFRNHFLRGDVPWIAECDLLLSELCRPVGHEQFIMAPEVRDYLLGEMCEQRMQEASRLLIRYVNQLSRMGSPFGREELQAEQWSAMAYLTKRRSEVARQIAESFRTTLLEDISSASAPKDFPPEADLARLVRITNELAPRLNDHPELLRYAEEFGRLLSGKSGATVISRTPGLGTARPMVQVAGVSLPAFRPSGKVESKKVSNEYHGYDYNVFVSYAWRDNQPFGDSKKGWVSTFVDRLRKHLDRELGHVVANDPTWLDYEMRRGHENIADHIRAKLEASRLLVPIISKSYLDSPWCRQELEIFLNRHGADAGRIFPVWMEPVGNLPIELDALLKYQFWYEDDMQQPRIRWFPDMDPTDKEYVHTQQDMARDMTRRLKEIWTDDQDTPTVEPEPAGPQMVHPAGDHAVLVLGGEEDTDLIREVANCLFNNHGIGYLLPLFALPKQSGLKSLDSSRDLREKLKVCTAVVIVYRNGPKHQIQGHITQYMKTMSQRPRGRPTVTLDLCRPAGESEPIGVQLPQIQEHLCDPDCAADCARRVAERLIHKKVSNSYGGYDIFVSYAHVDDDPLPGIDKGWVSTFVDVLRQNLARELGRPDAYTLWMDYELRGHEPLRDAVRGQLSAAKTMVLFLSKGYLASSWCMEELEIFAGRLGPDTDRIFPVYVSPVDEIPQSLKQLRKYDFWLDEREGPRTLADPQPIPTEREYYQGIRRLARELAEKLRGFRPTPHMREGLTVFVTGGELDIELVRETAARLEKRGCDYVLPLFALEPADGNLPASAEAITRHLRDSLESCDAVLLLYREGPRTQVRQYINEYRKHKTRTRSVPKRIHLCQIQSEPENLGIHIPELHLVCAGETCLDECVERFLGEVSP